MDPGREHIQGEMRMSKPCAVCKWIKNGFCHAVGEKPIPFLKECDWYSPIPTKKMVEYACMSNRLQACVYNAETLKIQNIYTLYEFETLQERDEYIKQWGNTSAVPPLWRH